MHLLFETPAGYALFRVKKTKTLEKLDNLEEYMNDPAKLKKLQFKGTREVLLSTVKLMKGKMSKSLKKFLQKNLVSQEIEEKLAVADKTLAKLITSTLGINSMKSDKTDELMRWIRFNVHTMIEGISPQTLREMSVALAHGLGRYKLKLSADKVDTMVIQAVSLYGDLDKEINNYWMRLKEWYGYHFPELNKIVQDNIEFTKAVRLIGMRHKAITVDLSETFPEEVVSDIHKASEISVGTEINEKDEEFIFALADQIIDLDNYRESLGEYLASRMMAVAPNLSIMVGETIAAKLIAKAGSLINLAKYPASTIQILGAEKALFKSMKCGNPTPKYGTIYQSKVVGSAIGRVKGKISRTLSAKCALCVRYDALGEDEDATMGEEAKRFIEKRMEYLTQQENGGGKTAGKSFQADGKKNIKQGGYNEKGDFRLGKREGGFEGNGDAKPYKKVKQF